MKQWGSTDKVYVRCWWWVCVVINPHKSMDHYKYTSVKSHPILVHLHEVVQV
jgi:hypothetical protein